MSRFKVRLSTLMLLIVIIALVVGMTVQTMRYERLLKVAQERAERERLIAQIAAAEARLQLQILHEPIQVQLPFDSKQMPAAK